jgi:hypothetical protein
MFTGGRKSVFDSTLVVEYSRVNIPEVPSTFKAKEGQNSNVVEPARKVYIWTIYIEEVFQKINTSSWYSSGPIYCNIQFSKLSSYACIFVKYSTFLIGKSQASVRQLHALFPTVVSVM